jgi:hypothetical protein
VQQLFFERGVGDLECRGRFEGEEDGEGGEAADGQVDVEAPAVVPSVKIQYTHSTASLPTTAPLFHGKPIDMVHKE